MPRHLTEQLLEAHTRERDADGTRRLDVDQILIEDATGVMCALQFEQLGVPRVRVPLAVMYVDHNVLQIDDKNMDDHRYLQSFSARYGLIHSRPGNGISHYVHLERFGVPGALLAGADSHTTSAGALGMLAVGLGGLDIALAMAGEGITLGPQRVVGVEVRGRLRPWVSAKDIVLEILRRTGVRGGTGAIFEFFGEGVAALTVTERATIANMIMETGATTAVFPSDEQTRRWLRMQQREREWRPHAAEDGAQYDELMPIDLDRLVPLIALPSSPGNVVAVAEVAGEPVAQVCVGSSVNSSYEDLAIVAAILRDAVVSEACEMTVTPGSRQILGTIAASGVYADLVASGARMLEPICGPCIGIGQAPPAGVASVRTFNRNFPGRSGTSGDRVYLASPETAAACALRGAITDPRTLGDAPPERRPAPQRVPIDDRHFIVPPADGAAVAIVRGPNIVDPPKPKPVPEVAEGKVLIVVPDNVSTGDMAPDGTIGTALWANIPECAKWMFRRFDPAFHDRARRAGGGFIVAGHNYGQGSSRESAAQIPVELAIAAIAAKSFARIHRSNLIAQGVVPLELPDDAAIEQGERWRIDGLRAAVASGSKSVRVTRDGREPLVLRLALAPRERTLLLEGGALAAYRRTNARFAGTPVT
jgi:aconitate hydratase